MGRVAALLSARTTCFVRKIVYLVIYDSGWVSEHFLLSWYPSQSITRKISVQEETFLGGIEVLELRVYIEGVGELRQADVRLRM